MCCENSSRYSPEYGRRYKPENHSGCGIINGGCDEPSKAIKGSPRWNWEQIYGKLVTRFETTVDKNGHTVYKVVREPCGATTQKRGTSSCMSAKYRICLSKIRTSC